MAVVLDHVVRDRFDMVKYDSLEVMCRRACAFWDAFDGVRDIGHWHQPRGQATGKCKAKRHLAEDYDAQALEGSEPTIDNAEDDGRGRMKRKALCDRFATVDGAGGLGGGPCANA